MDVKKLIAKIDQQFMATFAEQNTSSIASFYSNDAILLPPNTEALSGTELIQGFIVG